MTAIIEKGYHVTPEQIEHMAREVGKGVVASTTYLRCLIVAAQESKKRKPLSAINEAHELFYPAVLRGVGNEQRAATFARTAASTLRLYAKRGGKLADIDIEKASKATLRTFGKPAESGDRAERSANRATDALLRAVRRMARKNATAARRLIAEAVEALKGAVPAGTRRATKTGENDELRTH